MQTGIFRGIEKGIMKIEYPVSEIREGKAVMATRIASYPIAGKIRSVNWHFGPDTERGYPYDAMPSIGQEIIYDGPAPDTAGHMMVDVYPAGVA